MADLVTPGSAGLGQFTLDTATGQVRFDPQSAAGWPTGVTETRATVAVRDAAGAWGFSTITVDVTRAATIYPGLVGLWKLGEVLGSAPDLSGNGKTATIADNGAGNITTTTLGGRPAVSANGAATAARYTLGSITSADPISLVGRNAATVIFRMAGDGGNFLDNPGRRVIEKSNGGLAANGWGVWTAFTAVANQRALAAGVGGSSVSTQDIIQTAATPQTYGVSFFATGASATHLFYRGGALHQAVVGTLPAVPSTTTNAALMNWNHATDRLLDGVLDYVAVFDRELPAAEHAAIAADPSVIGA